MPKINKTMALFRIIASAAIVIGSSVLSGTGAANAAAPTEDPRDPAVERAWQEVKMLDDIYWRASQRWIKLSSKVIKSFCSLRPPFRSSWKSASSVMKTTRTFQKEKQSKC